MTTDLLHFRMHIRERWAQVTLEEAQHLPAEAGIGRDEP
jgi:hypothetical protein